MIRIPGRIPIYIYPLFWLLAGFIGWINSNGDIAHTAIWIGVIVLSVLIHEYGHALSALAFGQSSHIELMALGGMTNRQGPKLRLWKEFLIVLNGPIAGLLLCIAAELTYDYLGRPPVANGWIYALVITIYANLFWTILNLLPIYPLDGGRLLSIILESIFGLKGVKIGFIVSSCLAVLGAIFLFYAGSLLAGSIFLMLAYESYRSWSTSQHVIPEDQEPLLQQTLKEAEMATQSGQLAHAEELLREIRLKANGGVLYLRASEQLAAILSKRGDIQEAYQMLLPLEKRLFPQSLRLLQQLAYKIKEYRKAISVGDRSYQAVPGYDVALINAYSYAILGEEHPALGWLKRAIADGLPHVQEVLKSEQFNGIRQNSAFRELVK